MQQDAPSPLFRVRSKTDAALTRADAPSPRRRITAPSAVAALRNGRMQHTGTTPPLVPDGSPILGPRGANGVEGYCPSPYKTADTFILSRKRSGVRLEDLPPLLVVDARHLPGNETI